MIRELKFSILTQRYADEIYRFVKGMLGDAMEAEDATQEIFLRLWKNLSSVQLLSTRAWLYRTARHHCIDLQRKRQAAHSPVYLDHASLPELGTKDHEDPSRVADAAALKETIDAAVSDLPETLKSVFLLYEINGLRYREIAETLNIPTNSVKVYLSRARTKLQESLKEHHTWTNA